MAELVGGAILSGFINVLFERMATPEFMDLFVTQKMDGKLLQKLKTYLITINVVLHDAEYRQIALKDAFIKYFLEDLRDVAYQADDLLDLIAYKVTAAEIKANQRAKRGNFPWNLSSLYKLLSKKASKINQSEQVSMPSGVTKKIEEIVEILEILVKQIDPLGLKKNHRKDALPQREPTTSLVEESEIFGRKDDEYALFKSLEATDSGIGVIPIIGMGGIGKTTLARLVYNSSKTKELFVIRAWVCVSDNYDDFRIKKELLQQVNTSAKCDILSLQQIDETLKESLAKRKYLIVLDDLWEIGYDNWNKLQEPLKSGAPGSKIIVTTRIKDTARLVRTSDKECCLSTLNDDSCWQLFKKHAFVNGKGDESLQSFKEDILRKCEGLPLAAKMLGGLLRGKQKKAECDAILKSKFWELDCGVTPALMLSYQYLSSHLKHCFAYCAIFPKDYKIRKEEIIQLWMAECFVIKPQGGGESIVDLAERYFQELVSRSFFQEQKDDKVGSRSFFQEEEDDKDGSYFLMHDLIHDLAEKISGEFLVRMDEDNICEFRRKHRYFSFTNSTNNISTMFGSIQKAQFLHTFWSFGLQMYYVRQWDPQIIVDVVVNHLRCLRVLSLRKFAVVKLPNSIERLKHLRYLNLSFTGIKKLPKSVCSLYYLQTLILYYCFYLVELPEDIENLINLHSLDIRETGSLKNMPSGLGNLKNLCFLSNFVVGKQEGAGIDGLGQLQHLRGKLCISNLQNVVKPPEYILKNNKHLEALELVWSLENIEDSEHDVRVFERLQPNESINKLSIIGFRGKNIPDWVTNSSYTNIVSLTLDQCEYCTHLTEFDRLSSLEHLSISNCNAVTKISTTKPFKSLKTLRIRNMWEWQDWCFCEENDSENCSMFEKLEELTIENCQNLNTISPGRSTHMIFCSLNTLKIENCRSLKISNIVAISNFKQSPKKTKPPTNIALSGWKYYGAREPLVILKQLPSLMYSLQVVKHPGERIEEIGVALNALECVEIGNSELCECIPLEMFPILKHLCVNNCRNLKSLSASSEPLPLPLTSFVSFKTLLQGLNVLVTSLKHLKTESCDELESFPKGGLPKLQSLEIYVCHELIGRRLQWGLQRFNTLTLLTLSDYEGDDLDSFPEESLLPSSLISLTIEFFVNLKVINYKSLQNLTSLSKLEFHGCRNLRLSKEELPSSISVTVD